ncbi:MAG: serpin family protein [Myxococcales bacterium]|nr:serpin family protein [Myxococcales bacterium]
MSSPSRAVSLLLFAGAVAATCSPPPNEPAHPARPANADPEAGTPLDSSADVGAAGSGDASVDAAEGSPAEPVVPASLADSVNAFARDLHRELSAKEKGNLIYSPLSISVALTMTYAGARGETAEEMAKVLHLGRDATETHAGYAKLIQKLGSEPLRGAPEVRLANRLWPQKGMELVPEFAEVTRLHYRAPLEQLDFQSQPEASRQRINSWVEHETKERIAELLPKGSIHEEVRLVLTNAVYFHGRWATPFAEAATRDERFFVNGVTPRSLPTMRGTVEARYAALADAQVVELPYARGNGPELAMVIVLPKTRNGLPDLEKRFGREGVGAYVPELRPTRVSLWLPRFTATVRFKLKSPLEKLGMLLAFTTSADFSGITRRPPTLYIEDVYHKAFVETSEKGTEASAGTAVVMRTIVSDSPPPPEVKVDHPFLFFIHDRRSGAVLFAGRIVAPGG